MFSIDKFLSKANKGFVMSNRYTVQFVPVGSKTSTIFTGDVDDMVNTVDLPGDTFTTHPVPMLGQTVAKVIGYEKGPLTMTIYNTGHEYNTIQRWSKAQYDKNTGAFAFPDETIIDIIVTEYKSDGKPVVKHIFSACNLISYGAHTVSYNESTEVQTVQLEVDYRNHKIVSYIR